MDIYILMLFLWVCGWLYACGVHQQAREVINQKGSDKDKEKFNKGWWLQYVILFLGWPHYLGYRED